MAPAANMAPVNEGLSAEARLRGTAVKLAAAGRSSGVTTVITKALRAGTSICESALRASRRPSASSSVGASAAPIRHRFAGICVNTIVLTRPMRRAIRGAASCDAAVLHSGQGATAAVLLAGKPILQIPLVLEQRLTAEATVRLGAGEVVNDRASDAQAARAKLERSMVRLQLASSGRS